ncbi:TetR/AcrR family transcriptional regulator [Agromyces seonyuensis]|uniref:TetR family transcriptional regulator n=1 Tax=Agromyces seonyuensis TaxID=2662446 RepID=A0A6I4NYT7_9MICO|nr:TetR/AcrR family transcriptional regulator [Agromyces seonyuensis]MWB99438.1 TetR family transcriptional regulator [Agromyces seonyuensis]
MTATARGPYAKTAAVRRRILDAALEVFSATGYRATTMKEIAERAGMSQRGLVHHFANKADLLAAVLELRETESALLMPPLGSSIEAFAGMLDVVAENSLRPGLVELYSLLTAEGASPEHPAHAHFVERYAGLRSYFSAAFESLRADGEVDSVLDSDQLAAGFLGLIEGLQIQWIYDRRAIDPEPILRAYLAAVIPRFTELTAATRASRAAAPHRSR